MTWRETLHNEVYPLFDHQMRARGFASYPKESDFETIFSFLEEEYSQTLIPVKRAQEAKTEGPEVSLKEQTNDR